MTTKNILDATKSKSINEAKEEIKNILQKLESKDTDLSESMEDYVRLIKLNKQIEEFFKKRVKEISLIGKKEKK